MKRKLAIAVLGVSCWLLLGSAVGEAVEVYESQVTLPTYPWQPDVRHPYFPETDGRNIYPYTMQDDIQSDRTPRTYRTIVLESDLVKLTFIPELGGRIWEAIDKITGKPIFYVNHVVKPGLIAMRGAWISGSVEFNTGPQGHTVSAISPVDVLILPQQEDGSRSVAVGEIDRIYRLQWTVVVTLRPGRRFIEQRVTLYNRTEHVCPYYYWNCTAQPNTPGFRFVYPMTLGTDHAGSTFYRWPVNKGIDLSWGKNYRRMSSIFAYECDQDFFGSYDQDEDRGCVAFADHRRLPGKKAWTWGWGGDGIAHQRMLTDDDGPYNEVQTGPLRTQAETGRLDPHEAISWKEWWYPVHGLGGPFTYANRDICVRAEVVDDELDLRLIGTGTWDGATIRASWPEDVAAVTEESSGKLLEIRRRFGGEIIWEGTISPQAPVCCKAKVGEQPVSVWVRSADRSLASFEVPLNLPERESPKPRAADPTPEGIASEGWKMLLLGRPSQAIGEFEKALSRDPGCVEALLGLAHYKLVEAAPAEAEALARRAIEENPYDGRAQLSLAVALHHLWRDEEALDSAWRAELDPATVVPARGLIGKILIRRGRLEVAVDVLSASGPWTRDPVNRDRLAMALLRLGRRSEARKVAVGTLKENPLDAFAWYVLAQLDSPRARKVLKKLLSRDPECFLELVFDLLALDLRREALELLEKGDVHSSPMMWYTADYLRQYVPKITLQVSPTGPSQFESLTDQPSIFRKPQPMPGVFPSRLEELPVLQDRVESQPLDALAKLLLGDLRFHLRQYSAARKLWEESAKIDSSNPIPLRSLGMAAWKLDGDLGQAERYLRWALSVDSQDAIVGRDLASVLIAQAEAVGNPGEKRTLREKARDVLLRVLPPNMHRADIIEMTARLHNQLDEPEKAATLLDEIRVTCWEGAQGLHDEFRKAHFALGKRQYEAGRFPEAAAEFRRSLEYPENLGIGRREGTREAELYYWLGMALSRAGKPKEARAAWKTAADEPPSGRPEVERCRKLAQEALSREE